MQALLLFALLACLSWTASADSFRCGRKIVKTGDTVNVLMKKCGKPQRKFSSRKVISENGRQAKVGVSNWVYQRARKRDIIVSVRGGTVVQIIVE
jgi:hypothetical protein